MVFLPNSHTVPGVRGAGETEDGPGLGEEAGAVSRVEPVDDHDSFLIPRHHQVFIHRGPVHGWDGALSGHNDKSDVLFILSVTSWVLYSQVPEAKCQHLYSCYWLNIQKSTVMRKYTRLYTRPFSFGDQRVVVISPSKWPPNTQVEGQSQHRGWVWAFKLM